MHIVAPAGDVSPAGQAVHDVAPAEDEYVSGAQRAQSVQPA
jgi:hypothetical protein